MGTLVAAMWLLLSISPGPPDPRQGERLDGRVAAPAASDPARAAPRLLLSPLRVAAWVVLTPIDRGVGLLERHKVYDRVYETLTSDDRLLGVRPLIQFESGTALAGGLRVYDRRTLGAGSLLGASLQAGRRAHEVSVTFEPPGQHDVGVTAMQNHRTDALYGGGDGLPRDEQARLGRPVVRYGFEGYRVDGWYRRPLVGALAMRLDLGLDRRRYGQGIDSGGDPAIQESPVDPASVPGFTGGLRVARAGLELRLDGRPHPRYGSGVLAGVTGGYAQGLAGDPSRHASARGGVGGVLAFGDRALGLGVRAGLVEPLGTAPVPFEDLLSPTGSRGLRGLSLGRLRGRSELVATLEYRWLLAAWMDAILFVDRGNVYGARLSDLALGRAFTSVGLGLVGFDMDQVAYWASPPRFGVQLAITPDDGMRLSFALAAW
jgi:outer membrane protein assembly factor BamA